MNISDIGRMLQQLQDRVTRVERSSRLSHASLDNTAIVVKDGTGTVRAQIGIQADGTAALVAQDGPPPGAPTAPIVTAAIGGLRIVWDGTLADASPLPSDFDHIAVHVSTSSGYTPSPTTFAGTITRSGDGGMLPVTPLPYEQQYVVLVAVNTSGNAGPPSAETTATPLQVDAPDLSAGSVTAAAIQAGAVTADKLEAVLELATRLVAGDPAGARVELNSDGLRVYDSAGTLVIQFNAADGSATFTGTISGSTITGGVIQTAASGERITLNEGNQKKIIVYNSSGTAIGELSSRGLLVSGTSGAIAWLNPSATLPQLLFQNSTGTNTAYLQMAEVNPGDANLQFITGSFTADGFTDRVWRQYMGNDFAIIERIRLTSSVAYRGGRLNLHADYAEIGYMDSASTANSGYLYHQPGLVTTMGKHQVQPQAASTDSALYVNAATGHTGNLLRVSLNGTDKFTVDKDGNTTVLGNVTVTGRVKPSTTETANLTLQSSWTNYDATNYGTAQVRKTADGRAYLVGRLNAGTTTSGTLVATIPSGYWPVLRHAFPHRAPQASGDCTLLVNELGEVRIYDISGTISNVSLSAMTWPTF